MRDVWERILYPAGSGAVSRLRREFQAWLGFLDGVDEERCEDAAIAVSELVTNAVRAVPAGAEPAVVRAWLDGDAVTVETVNGYDGRSPNFEGSPDTFAGTGRGLPIVRTLTEALSIDAGISDIRVRCRIRLRPEPGPAACV